MRLNITFEHNLPEALIEGLGITEESEFETFFADGTIFIHLLNEDEAEESTLLCPVCAARCDGDCEICAVLDTLCTDRCSDCQFLGLCGEGRDDE